METPAFVLKVEFELPHTNRKGYAGMVDYMTDKEKARKGGEYHRSGSVEGLLAYMGDERKSSGLFTQQDDFLDKQAVKELKQSFREAEQNGSLQWKFVGSFRNDWLRERGILDAQGTVATFSLKQAVRAMMEQLIQEENFLPHNTLWTASFHHNTEHLHFHVSLVERANSRELVQRRKRSVEKTRSSNGRQYRFYRDEGEAALQPKGKLRQRTLGRMKSRFLNELTRERRAPLLEAQTQLREELIQELSLSQVQLRERRQFLSLLEALPSSQRQWHYQTIKSHYLKACERIDGYVQDYLTYASRQAEYEKLVQEEAAYRQSLYGGTNAYAENQLADLRYRLGNRLLKELGALSREEEQKRLLACELKREEAEKEPRARPVRFTRKDRRRLEQALGDEYEKQRNLRYHDWLEREAEWERQKQERSME